MKKLKNLIFILFLFVFSNCNENTYSLNEKINEHSKAIETDSSDLLINDTVETKRNKVYLFGDFYKDMSYKETFNVEKKYLFQTKDRQVKFKIYPKFINDKLVSVELYSELNENIFKEIIDTYQKKYGNFDKKKEEISRECRRNYKITKVFWGKTNPNFFKYDNNIEIYNNDIIEDLTKDLSNVSLTYEGVRIINQNYSPYNNVIIIENRVIGNGIKHHIILKNTETLDKYLFPVEIKFKNADLVWYEKSIFSKNVDEKKVIKITTINKLSDCLSNLESLEYIKSSLSNAINSIGAADQFIKPYIKIEYAVIEDDEIINEPEIDLKFKDSIIDFNKNKNFEDI